ncbi:MAG: hypothetical protein ACI8X5_002279 [Planctomycetota bacterium]|jgi:hypothetical protein
MLFKKKWIALASLVAAGSALVFAHVRLVHPSNSTPLYWNTTNLGITINSTGSDNISDGSDETALRNAIEEWNSIDGTSMTLVESATTTSTNWASNSLHLLMFDEDNSSGYFPNGSSTVAITPVWFYNSGRIDDADVLFNGKGFAFTTSQEGGHYDVQDVAVHEIGHLLGLDHTGWAGGSMYPYVDPTVILHRSLSQDERQALRYIYPSGTHARISGTIKRLSNGTVVKGAHVVVRDSDGRTMAGALTNGAGSFSVGGLDAGTYQLYVTPLDFPVSSANIGAGWTIQTDFESTVHGNVTLTAGQIQALGDISVGANVSLSLGRNADRYPLRAPKGATTNFTIRGSGLNAGSTLSCSDPSITISSVLWFGSQVRFDAAIPGAAINGHADMWVINTAVEESILPAALEITPADPIVTLASPNQGSIDGGTSVTITGTGFNAGARVIVGGEIYEDGATGGCTVASSTSITLTTRSGASGIFDVVVIDPSGVEGRQSSAYQFIAVPTISTVFPPVGSSSGSTVFRIGGTNFEGGSVVRINNVVQGTISLVNSGVLEVTAGSEAAGGPYLLEVVNPGGGIATSTFSYANSPDPVISSVTPSQGSASGGEVVVITGSNFTVNTEVTFGADSVTGQGGASGTLVTVLSSTSIEVTTPASGSGIANVIASDSSSGQATVLSAGFSFLSSDSGGGGGCYTVPVQGPPNWGDVLRTALWFALMALGAHLIRPRMRRVMA